MSPSREFESKNVEKALQKASEALNIPADKLEHEVISHGSTGIFGLVGAKKAKIRITIPDEALHQKVQHTREKQQSTAPEIVSMVNDGSEEKSPAADYEGAALLGRDVIKRLVDFIDGDAVVDVVKNGDQLHYNISGGDAALLIGKRGQTLEAMQYLVEKIINKQQEKRIRIQIDIEGYLDSRRERLESLALRMGEKARHTEKSVTVGQFNAHDRRIIHMVLKNDDTLRTQSVGEGYYRKIKIFPRKRGKKSNGR